MGKRDRRPQRAKEKRFPRIGLAGPEVDVTFSTHAFERFVQRLAKGSFNKDEFVRNVREPNTKKRDEDDPRTGRVRRWFRTQIDGVWYRVRVIFEVTRPQTQGDPGAIRVVTVIVEEPREE